MNYLTSLRGLAALIVLLFHIEIHLRDKIPGILLAFLKNGYLAVDFFFILSGYILTYTYQSQFHQLQGRQYQQYLIKRFARIYPLHFFLLLAYLMIPAILFLTGREIHPVEFSPVAFIYKLLLIDSWWNGYNDTWNVPSWSISVEMFAYFLFPVVVYFLKNKHPIVHTVIFSGMILGIAFSFKLMGYTNIGQDIHHLGMTRGLGEFVLGICSYFIQKNLFTHFSFSGRVGLFLGVLFIVVAYQMKIYNYFYIPLGFSLILMSLVSYSGMIQKILLHKSLVYLGDISYSVYLSHNLILNLMVKGFLENHEIASTTWVLSYITLTLGFSCVTYHYLEMPARHWIVNKFAPSKA